MGGQDGGAVFAAVLDTRSNLLGRWIHLKGFRNINDRSAPPARDWFRLLTETDLIELEGSQVTVKPIQYRGKTFCYWEPRAAKDVCEELLLHEWSRLAMGFDLGAAKGNFDMFAYLDVLAAPPPNAPTPAAISAARSANSSKNAAVGERKAADGFLTRDLKDSQALLDVHDGRFEASSVRKDSFLASQWLYRYIRGYAAACGPYLPAHKVPIPGRNDNTPLKGQVCQDYFPAGTNPPGCTKWKEEVLFADPRLADLSHEVGLKIIRNHIERITTPRVPRVGESVSQPGYDEFACSNKMPKNYWMPPPTSPAYSKGMRAPALAWCAFKIIWRVSWRAICPCSLLAKFNLLRRSRRRRSLTPVAVSAWHHSLLVPKLVPVVACILFFSSNSGRKI